MRDRAKPKGTKTESRTQRAYCVISFGSDNLLWWSIARIFCLSPQEAANKSKEEEKNEFKNIFAGSAKIHSIRASRASCAFRWVGDRTAGGREMLPATLPKPNFPSM